MVSALTVSLPRPETFQSAAVEVQVQNDANGQSSVRPTGVSDVSKAGARVPLQEPGNQKVSDLLSHVSGTNALIDLFNHTDWAALEAHFGIDNINKQRIETIQSLEGSLGSLSHQAGQLGVPVNVTIIPNVGSASGLATASVSAFTFKDGASTYAVAPSPDGTLVGTKDGQAWGTWELNNRNPVRSSNETGADVALQTLVSAAKLISHTTPNIVSLQLTV